MDTDPRNAQLPPRPFGIDTIWNTLSGFMRDASGVGSTLWNAVPQQQREAMTNPMGMWGLLGGGLAATALPLQLIEQARQTAPSLNRLPTSVMRVSEKGYPAAQVAEVAKPHGLYTSPANVRSPHLELGGPQATFNVNPAAKVLTVDASELVRTNRGLAGQSAGIAVVRHFLGDQAQRLMQMNRKELQDALQAKYPSVQWAQYHDQHEMLEGLGGVLARQHGYDAIWAIDRGDARFNEYVGLNQQAFK